MCARIRSPKDLSQLPKGLYNGPLVNFEFNANVAPTEKVPMVIKNQTSRMMVLGKFGITPVRAKNKSTILINTKAETIKEKPNFKSAYQKRRCIIPAEGFYEWKEERGIKQPYFFHRKDGQPILFAGIWELVEKDAEKTYSFSIVTCEPNELVIPYHDRMPLIIDDFDTWLNPQGDPLDELCPLPPESFSVRPVNPAMNKPSEKNLSVIEG